MKPIILCGEAMGANEVRTGTPFVGASGIELLRMLDESGLLTLTAEDHAYLAKFWQTSRPEHVEMVWRMHPEVHRTNVFNLHPPGNDLGALCGSKADAIQGYPTLVKSKYVRAEFAQEIERLGDEILRLNPNLIICLGNASLWALSGITGISKLRGTTCISSHCVSGFKLLATFHPAAVIRQWELRPTVIADFIKAKREAAFPEVRRPEREIWIEPTLEDIHDFLRTYVEECSIVSIDIETVANQITCIGIAPSKDMALVVPFYDIRRKNRSFWATSRDEHAAWNFVRGVLEVTKPKKSFQNGLYDIAFLWRSMGIAVRGAEHDTMLLHHALQPESLKALGFLGSIYTDESAWKQERKRTKTIKRDE